jgi:zinc protease
VGSQYEGYGETGMAHLLEHMVFKGTPKNPNIPQQFKERGASFNGTTSFERTNYFLTVPANDDNLKWALNLEADRMVNSNIAKTDLETEFSVVRNEFEAGENNPFGVLYKQTLSAMFDWHNYGNSTIGNRSDVENVPIERLKAFYKKYYQPDNAVLLIAGNFETTQALKQIATSYGTIPRPKRILEKFYTSEPVQDGQREVAVRRLGDTPLLLAMYHVPSALHPDFAAVDVMTSLLGDNPSGPLYKALVEGKKAAQTGSFVQPLRQPGFTAFMGYWAKKISSRMLAKPC